MAGKISVIMAPKVLGSGKRRGCFQTKVQDRLEAVEIENVPCSRGCHIEVIQGNVVGKRHSTKNMWKGKPLSKYQKREARQIYPCQDTSQEV